MTTKNNTLHPDKLKLELRKRTTKYLLSGISILETMEKVAFDMQKDYGISAEPILNKIKKFRLNLNKG